MRLGRIILYATIFAGVQACGKNIDKNADSTGATVDTQAAGKQSIQQPTTLEQRREVREQLSSQQKKLSSIPVRKQEQHIEPGSS